MRGEKRISAFRRYWNAVVFAAHHKKSILIGFGIDVLFTLAFFAIWMTFSLVRTGMPWADFALVLVYLLVIIAIYATAKYFVLKLLIPKARPLNIGFYGVSFILSLVVLVLLFVMVMLGVGVVNPDAAGIFGLIFLIVLFILLYPVFHMTQIGYLKKKPARWVLEILLARVGSVGIMYLINLILIVAYSLIFQLISLVYTSYSQALLASLTALFLYILHALNRIFFASLEV